MKSKLNGIQGKLLCIMSNHILLGSKARLMAERPPEKEKAETPKSKSRKINKAEAPETIDMSGALYKNFQSFIAEIRDGSTRT